MDRPCLDQEHQAVARLQAVDHRRGELGPRTDVVDHRGEVVRTAVAAEAHLTADAIAGNLALRREEAQADAVVRQQRDDRLVRRRPLPDLEEHVLDAGGRRRARRGLGQARRGIGLRPLGLPELTAAAPI